MADICGLHWVSRKKRRVERHYLTQVDLRSQTHITRVSFSTTLQQKFANDHPEPIEELRYTFPLYDGVSVCSYTIRYGDEVLEGVVQQKDIARKTYQAAADSGATASLLERLPAGVFGVTIANLPARTDVFVDIQYAGELKHDAGIDGLRYILPTRIAPRYGDYPGNVDNLRTRSGGIKITVDVDMGKSAIRRMQSPSHPIAVTTGNVSTTLATDEFSPSKGSVSLTQDTTELESDFILQILIDDLSNPLAILEKHESLDSRAIMATLVPKFNLPLGNPEIVFIADQSGSMSGGKNTALVAALQVFLKSLPFGVRFNICAFGSNYKYLWSKSQAYNEDNLQVAVNFVQTFQAHMGGTEMLEPVKQAFLRHLKDLPLEIMLLTDGEIWGEEQLFKLINEKIHDEEIDARVFALGIGRDVSHTLVEGVARAGNGFAQFVVQNEETDAKLVRMLKASLFPHTKNYTLELNFDDRLDAVDDFEIVERVSDQLHLSRSTAASEPTPSTTSFFDDSVDLDKSPEHEADRYAHLPSVATPRILQAPSQIPPLFPYNRTNLYLLLGPDAPTKDVVSVTIRASAPSGPLELTIPVHFDERSKTTIHTLAARKAIQELEEGRGWLHQGKTTDGSSLKEKYGSRFDEIVEREAVRLGETFQIAGKWCSFVAVDGSSAQQHLPASRPRQFNSQARYRKRKVVRTFDALPPPSESDSDGFDSMPRQAGRFLRADDDEEDEADAEDQVMDLACAEAPPATARAAVASPFAFRKAMPVFARSAVNPISGGSGGLFGGAACFATVSEPAGTPASPAELLRRVINMQTFVGSWSWSAELIELIDARVTNITQRNNASATALVLAFLEVKMKVHEDVWEMVAQKARAWLAQQQLSEGVDEAVENAKQSLV